MPRASDAPFTPDIVRCSKSWTTVDAGKCSQCSPTNGHQEEDTLLFHERSLGRSRLGRAVVESLPKNLIAAHPVQGSQANEGSGGTCSPATPYEQRYGTGKAKGRLRCGLSEAKEGEKEGLRTFCFMPAAGRERASGGIQESETRRDGNWCNQLASTIKERNSHNYVD